jgi:hypothetical protein
MPRERRFENSTPATPMSAAWARPGFLSMNAFAF